MKVSKNISILSYEKEETAESTEVCSSIHFGKMRECKKLLKNPVNTLKVNLEINTKQTA